MKERLKNLRRRLALIMAIVMFTSCMPMQALAEIISVSRGIQLFSIAKPQGTYVTYEFYNGDQQVATQIVKSGDELYAPVSPQKDGYKFMGWSVNPHGGEPYQTFGPVGELAGDSRTQPLYAHFEEIHYVFFHDDHGRVYATKEGVANDSITTGDVAFPVKAEEAITGWYRDGGLTQPVGDPLTLGSENIHLYAKVETGHWITYETGDQATYIAPVFVAPSGVTAAPAEQPARPGYIFSEWGDTNENPFTFGGTLDQNITLRAIWNPQVVNYTVIYWQENADYENPYLPDGQRDSERYSFKESVTLQGLAGTETAAQAGTVEAGFRISADHPVTQQTIKGDGSTIVNVYYDREVYTIRFEGKRVTCGIEEHKHSSWNGCYNWGKLTCDKEEHTHSDACYKDYPSITAKYGARISSAWPTNSQGSTMWEVGNGNYQSYIGQMPLEGGTFYEYKASYNAWQQSAQYYVQVLSAKETEVTYEGVNYKLDHTDLAFSSTDLTITKEDKYPMTGFTYYNTSEAENGKQYDGAKFYYTRNTYSIHFFQEGVEVKTVNKLYEQSMDGENYTPERPNIYDENYTFKGWFDNPAGQGEPYTFSGAMPAKDITVYAKWEPVTLHALVHLTMDTGSGTETVDIPYGTKLDEATLDGLKPPIPEGFTWHGWCVRTGSEGNYTYIPFNFNTVIYGDIELYPYYTSTASFTVAYNLGEGTGTAPVDAKKYAQDSYADVQLFPADAAAPEGKVFLCWTDDAGRSYYPNDKLRMPAANVTLHAQYGEADTMVNVTYHSNFDPDQPHIDVGTPNNSLVTLLSYEETGLPARNGYRFLGWSTQPGATAPEFAAGEQARVNKVEQNDLYAVWQQFYTVTYAFDGPVPEGFSAPLPVDPTEYAAGDTVTVKPRITAEGYTITEWYHQEGESITIAGGTFTMPHNNVTLYCKVERSTANYVIHHYLDGTNVQVAGDVHGVANVGSTVKADPATALFKGYEQAMVSRFDPEGGSITVTVDDAANVITVYYKVPLIITAKDATKTYDGAPLTQAGFTVEGLVNGDANENFTLSMTADSTITNVGTQSNVIDQGTVKYKGADIPSYYDVTYENGTLTINPRAIELTAGSGTKEYDGTPLMNSSYTITSGMFVTGEGLASVTVEGSQTLVGVGENTITRHELNENTKAENYTITYKPGTLSVTNRTSKYEVTLVANSNTDNTYDGTPKSATGVETDKFTINGVEYTVSGYTTSDPTEVNAGEYENTINGDCTVLDEQNNDVTAQFTVNKADGKLVIAKKTVTLTSATLSKPYDGTPLTNGNEPLEVETGWVGTEGATYTFTGSQTLVGSSENTFEISAKDQTDLKNYEIFATFGTLTITDDNVTVDVVTKTHTAGEYSLGETVTFPIRVTNIYNEEKTITLTELPGVQLAQNTFPNVAPGDTVETTATYTVTEADILAGAFVNTVTASFDGGKDFTDTDTVDTEDPNAAFTVAKVLNNLPARGYFTVGETAEFTVTVTNTGNQTLENVEVTEQLSGAAFTAGDAGIAINGSTATIASLAPNASANLTAAYTVTLDDLRADEAAPVLRNVVAASGTSPDPLDDPEGTDEEEIPTDTYVTIAGTKVWNDENNAFGTRPEAITLALFAGETRLNEVQATAANGWTYDFGRLPAHDAAGNAIPYVVRDEVTGYEAEMTPDYQVTNNLMRHTLTIRYWFDRVGGLEASATVMRSYLHGQPYNVVSPGLRGYTADRARVTGVMTGDIVEDVVFTRNNYTITVNYVYQGGAVAAPAYQGVLGYDDAYFVQSPVLTGYTASSLAIAGTMEDRNLVFTVIYVPDTVTVVIDEYGVPLGIGAVERNVGDCFE